MANQTSADHLVALQPADRQLLLELRQLLQSMTAVTRGLLASQPRPLPRGEWGRPIAAPAPEQRGPMRIEVQEAPADGRRVVGRWRKHTPESIATDRSLVERCLSGTGMSIHDLCKEAGVSQSNVYRASHGLGGLPDDTRERLEATARRLRRGRS